jgi:hypothetical protein
VIRFVPNEMIDKSRWDDCISNAINGNLNSYSWYLDIVSPGWCAMIEGDYECIFPLPVSSRAGFRYIMQPPFTQQLGLFYSSLPSQAVLTRFISSIPPVYKYIDINLNTSNRMPGMHDAEAMTNIELDLFSDYDKIYSGYQKNLQRNLKKAAQNKLTIAKHVKPEDIISLFRMNKGKTVKHLQMEQYAIMQQIAYESIYRGIGEIWGAYDEYNRLTAAILWATSHQKTILLFSGVSENGKAFFAMPLLIDTFIRQYAGKSLTLDFEGSNNEGLARFYCSFGAKKVTYQRYYHNSLPLPYRIGLKIWRKCRSLLKKYTTELKQ